jgi:hypothetical protein
MKTRGGRRNGMRRMLHNSRESAYWLDGPEP